jgi:hypothetical protein
MADEVFCVFVITACVVTLAMPAVAQTMFAVFGIAIVVATRVSRRAGHDLEPADPDRHEVPGLG